MQIWTKNESSLQVTSGNNSGNDAFKSKIEEIRIFVILFKPLSDIFRDLFKILLEMLFMDKKMKNPRIPFKIIHIVKENLWKLTFNFEVSKKFGNHENSEDKKSKFLVESRFRGKSEFFEGLQRNSFSS